MNSEEVVNLPDPVNITDPGAKLSPLDKAVLITFALGKTYMHNLDIVLHELKVSPKKEHNILFKEKMKRKLKLYREMQDMFAGAGNFLRPAELQSFEDAVERLTHELW
jgi:hypothetical protein